MNHQAVCLAAIGLTGCFAHSADIWCASFHLFGWQQRGKLQAETIPVAIAHSAGNAEKSRRLEFNLHQVSGLQRDAAVKRHSAAADFGGQSWDSDLGNVVNRNDAYREFHLMTRPTASVCGGHCYFSRCTWST